MYLLFTISNIKIHIKTLLYSHSYMFRSVQTIIRESILRLAKVTFCKYKQYKKYVVIINAVLWQHVCQVVVCVLGGVQSETEFSQSLCTPRSTHTTT
jgi:hypothetical protein